MLVRQIRAELVHHNIRLYPFDTDENDEEELAQNDTIRVRHISSPNQKSLLIDISPEHDPLRRSRFRAQRDHRRQARSWS
jgi:hypothetical protein